MKVHHIGYAVKNISAAVEEFMLLGYVYVGEKIIDETRNIDIQFMRNDNCLVELIAPVNENSPVSNILKKIGNTPYHICYETYDMQDDIRKLSNNGYRVLYEPAPAIAFDGKKVCFMHNKDIGILELVEV